MDSCCSATQTLEHSLAGVPTLIGRLIALANLEGQDSLRPEVASSDSDREHNAALRAHHEVVEQWLRSSFADRVTDMASHFLQDPRAFDMLSRQATLDTLLPPGTLDCTR